MHKTPITHNLTELFVYPGLAILFTPHFNVLSISLLLVLIAVYDMFSVWKSKHMIMLAKAQEKADMYTGYYLPMDKGHIFLGGGDIAFPMLFTSVVFHQYGWIAAIVPFFMTVGVSFIQNKQKYCPAMLVLSIAWLLTVPFLIWIVGVCTLRFQHHTVVRSDNVTVQTTLCVASEHHEVVRVNRARATVQHRYLCVNGS